MNRPLKLSLAVALALVSSQALALGLGTIEVKSKMNEPLLAEIEVVAASTEEAQALRVQLADAEDFARVGLDMTGLTVPLEFSISSNEEGEPVIVVSSRDPVREPFLSFLVEVDWTNGRLLREFSVLLDPPVAPAIVGTRPISEPVVQQPEAAPAYVEPSAPEVSEPAPDPVFEPVEPVEPAASEAAPEPEPEPIAEEPAAPEPEPMAEEPPAEEPFAEQPIAEEPAPAPVYEPEPERAPGEYGPVAEGETLWEIANNTRAAGANTNQMMLAILRANPQAFYKDNVNALKRGAILRIPAQDEIAAIAASEALAEIVAQHQAWASQTVVADSGYSPPPSAPAPSPSADPDSRLALVPPRSGSDATSDQPGVAGGTDNSAELRAELARAKEQLASSTQETVELRERVQELEKIQGDTKRLLELRSTDMAELQRRLAAAEAETERLRIAQAAAETAAAQAAASLAASNVTPETTTAPDTSSPTPTDPAVPPADETLATETPPADATTTDPAAVDPAAVDPAAIDPAEPDAIATDATAATDAAPVDGDETGATDSASIDTTDAAETADGTTDGAEVTPLPEPEPVDTSAPVEPDSPSLMAYLRNPWVLGGAGALALLALAGLLARARRRNVDAGEERASVADSFHGGVFGKRGAAPAAAAVAATAAVDEERQLLERLASDPTDTEAHLDLLRLYYARGDADKFEAAAGALYAQVPAPTSPAWLEAAEMGRTLCPGNSLFEAEAAEREEFDFSRLDEPAPMSPPSAPEPAASRAAPAESFDFNLLDEAPKATPAPAPIPAPAPKPVPAFTDDRTQQMAALDFTTIAAEPAPEPEPAGGDFMAGGDAVGTKLDLARAYLDMGDPEGARSMLQEVLAEGNASQKSEANRLLADIG